MRARLLFSLALVLGGACVGPQDTPSQLKDLRVLAVKLSPPERMGGACSDGLEANFPLFPVPVQVDALIVDPAGNGRPVAWELRACARPDDATCTAPDESTVLASGTLAQAGILSFSIRPALATVGPEAELLLPKVLAADPYKGLGGLRLPLVLHVSAGDERIDAQKLMVFSCRLFPEQTVNENPELPGLELPDGSAWSPDASPTLRGAGPFRITAADFSAREVAYTVPDLQLKPVKLNESWTLAWYTEDGAFSPETTGGTDFVGQSGRNFSQWQPARRITEARDVRFHVVVRDGRGGMSWLTRSLHFEP